MTPDPVVAVGRFIASINSGDAAGLGALATGDYQLVVFDEPPVCGRDANVAAWLGYATSFPEYTISPHQIVERAGVVAVLGHTTGSHLGLPDDEERLLAIIWVAEVIDGKVRSWRLVEDSVERRREFGLDHR